MSRFDFRPKTGGAEYDPVNVGGQVTAMTLFTTADRSGAPTGVVPSPTRPRPGVYRFEIPDTLPPGRYWCSVTYTPAANMPTVVDSSVRLDLPLGTGLVTSPEAVAKQLRMPLPLTVEQREDFLDEIRTAQADVQAHIGRPLVPYLAKLTGVMPAYGVDPGDWRAWRGEVSDEDFEVDAYTAYPDGTYDVTLQVGLDGAVEEPIRRYVAVHAAEMLRLSGVYGKRRVSSVSAEGQSVSYEASPGSNGMGSRTSRGNMSPAAGQMPTLSSLDEYRFAPVFVRKKYAAAPWPYGPSHFGRW